ncbi:DNA-processing protein DprA [Patescibacteria group bacterium]|nr:DNA-processing protein DprA [Patescibacteria group bacterium]
MKKYWVAFGSVPNIRSEHWQKIIAYFPTLKDAWLSKTGDLLSAGLGERWIDNLSIHRDTTDPDKLLEGLERDNIEVINITEDKYPSNLKEIYSPPFLIYIKGELKESDVNSIAIVGSRKGTDYGKRATFEIAKELGKSGVTVVSGLALGLDTEAHKGALSGSGRTIAVLANGLKTIYPTSNTNLGKAIINNGCLISEQPPDMPALRQNFPARNRIISGLSLGTLITEAGEHSGTLHTASFAIEQNRQIYAIPGPIYNPLAKGPNNLLKNGAKAVTESSDILEDFGIENKVVILKPKGPEEEMIFNILKNENLHIDEITKQSELEPAEISKTLTMMEISGKVRHLGGMIYSLRL